MFTFFHKKPLDRTQAQIVPRRPLVKAILIQLPCFLMLPDMTDSLVVRKSLLPVLHFYGPPNTLYYVSPRIFCLQYCCGNKSQLPCLNGPMGLKFGCYLILYDHFRETHNWLHSLDRFINWEWVSISLFSCGCTFQLRNLAGPVWCTNFNPVPLNFGFNS